MINVRQAQLKVSRIVLAIAMIAGTAIGARAATATWDANPEPDIAGYKLSYGTQSGVHTTIIDVGKATTCQFSLAPGQTYYVVVQAYNTAGNLSAKSAEAILSVPLLLTNSAPILAQPANQTTTVNTNVSLALSASDAEGKALMFTATGLPPGLSVNSASGLISGSAIKTGSYQVTVTASDGALSTSRTFTWTVADAANLPPVLAQPADQTSVLNANVSLALSASDPEGAALRFSASGLPIGLSINSASGVISGVAGKAGAHQVTVTVSDGTLSVSRTFGWTVTDAPSANRPPTLTQPENQTSTMGAAVSLPLSATDPEGARLTFTATGLPRGLSISSTSGLISGVPQNAGSDKVTVSVSDGALSTSRNFTWTVVSKNGKKDVANDAPVDPEEPAPLPDYEGVSGDFDGDGRLDLATYRSSSSEWRIWTSSSNFVTPTDMVWGEPGDRPMAADYNGDRITDLAVYRPATGMWHLWLSRSQTPLTIHWGGRDDSAFAIDHDGDGKADLAVIRNGGYEILLSTTNYLRSVQIR